MNPKAFRLENLKFRDPPGSIERFLIRLLGEPIVWRAAYLKHERFAKDGRSRSHLNGPRTRRPRIGFRELLKEKFFSLPFLDEAIGFDKPAIHKRLAAICDRSWFRFKIVVWLYFLLSCILFFPLVFASDGLFRGYSFEESDIGVLRIASPFLKGITIYVIFGSVFKISAILTDRFFVEARCVETIVHLILELSRDDVLENPDRRIALLLRINHLAQKTLQLSSRYSSKNWTFQMTWMEVRSAPISRMAGGRYGEV